MRRTWYNLGSARVMKENRHLNRIVIASVGRSSDVRLMRPFWSVRHRLRLRPRRFDRTETRERSPQVRDYDLTVILKPDLGDDGVTSTSEKIGSWITAGGGHVVSTTSAGRKRLAYPIDHLRDGTYVVLQVQARPDSLGPIERNLKLSEDVVRYMVLRK